jgi:hypothetical protein
MNQQELLLQFIHGLIEAEPDDLVDLRTWAHTYRMEAYHTQGVRDFMEGLISLIDNIDFERRQLKLL